jgi:hypothetical protein
LSCKEVDEAAAEGNGTHVNGTGAAKNETASGAWDETASGHWNETKPGHWNGTKPELWNETATGWDETTVKSTRTFQIETWHNYAINCGVLNTYCN